MLNADIYRTASIFGFAPFAALDSFSVTARPVLTKAFVGGVNGSVAYGTDGLGDISCQHMRHGLGGGNGIINYRNRYWRDLHHSLFNESPNNMPSTLLHMRNKKIVNDSVIQCVCGAKHANNNEFCAESTKVGTI